jgi:alpha/beta superfamily hydrolase
MTGDADEFGDLARLRPNMEAMGARSTLIVAPGGDHFWWGGVSALTRESTKFLRNIRRD